MYISGKILYLHWNKVEWVDSFYIYGVPYSLIQPQFNLFVPSIYGLKADLYEKYNLMHIKVDSEHKPENQPHTPLIR